MSCSCETQCTFLSSSNHSSSNTDHFTSTSSNEEILEDMDENDMVIFYCITIVCDSHNFFTSHEIEEGARQYVDAGIGV